MRWINRHNGFLTSWFKWLFLSLCLAYCSPIDAQMICIDADDFGFPKVFVPSTNEGVIGQHNKQVKPWLDSGFTLASDPEIPLVIKVYAPEETKFFSRWTSWFNGQFQGDNCQFANNDMCPDPTLPDLPVVNHPCWFVHGQGLYGLIAPPFDPNNLQFTDPNRSSSRMQFPPSQFLTFHLARDPNNSVDNYNQVPPSPAQKGGGLYFKILDKRYDDNFGGYIVGLKSGVQNRDPGVITQAILDIKRTITGAAKNVFNRVIFGDGTRVSDFAQGAQALLVLYVTITALMYSLGLSKLSRGVFISHVLKIAIISQLISPGSWVFFHDHFFSIFLNGVEDLILLVTKAAMGPTAKSGLDFFDFIISTIFSHELNSKIMAFIFSGDGVGILYALVVYIALYTLFFAVLKAVFFFLMSTIGIALLIAAAPLFICFFMFQLTRDFFNRWTRNLVSYTLQPIMVFAGISFVTVIIFEQLQKLLGFRVCNELIFDANVAPGLFPAAIDPATGQAATTPATLFQIHSWVFNIRPTKNIIPVPNGHIDETTGQWVGAYAKLDERFIDMPFLDPSNADDLLRIKQIAGDDILNRATTALDAPNIVINNILDFEQLFVFSALVYLVFKFNDLIPGIARMLSDTGAPFGVALEGVTKSAYQGAGQVARFSRNLASAGFYRKAEKVGNALTKRIQLSIGTNVYKIENRFKGIKNPISSRFNKSVDALAKQGAAVRHRPFDAIGDRLHYANEIRGLFTDHLKYRLTLGIFGRDAAKKNGSNGSLLEQAVSNQADLRGWSDEQKLQELNRMNGAMGTLDVGPGLGVLAGLTALNPLLALGAAGIMAGGKIGSNIMHGRSALDSTDKTGPMSSLVKQAKIDLFDAARDRLEAAQADPNASPDELLALKQEMDLRKAEVYGAFKHDAKDLESDYKDHVKQLELINKEIRQLNNSMDKENRALQSLANSANRDMSAVTSQYDQMKEQLSQDQRDLEGNIALLSDALPTASDDEKQSLTQQIRDLESRLRDVNQDIHDLDREHNDQVREHDRIEEETRRHAEEAARLEEELKKRLEEQDEANAFFETHTTNIHNLADEYHLKETDIGSYLHQDEISNLYDKTLSTNGPLADLECDASLLAAKRDEYRTLQETLEEQKDRLRGLHELVQTLQDRKERRRKHIYMDDDEDEDERPR
jgi:type IV secretory pathway VirB6-like protein